MDVRKKLELPILIFALFLPAMMTYAYFVLGKGMAVNFSKSVYVVGKSLQLVLPVVVTAFLLKARWWVRRPNARGLLVGALFGVVVGITIYGLGCYGLYGDNSWTPLFERTREELLVRLKPLGLDDPFAFSLFLAFYCIFHSGFEEYYWRWFVVGQLAKRTSFVPAMLIGNAGFTLHHIVLMGVYFGVSNWQTWFACLGVFVGGCVWQLIYKRSDSIYGAWLSHAFIDAGIFVLGFKLIS